MPAGVTVRAAPEPPPPGLVLGVRPPFPLVTFGPLGPPRFRLHQADEREAPVPGALFFRPPRLRVIFGESERRAMRIVALDERGTEGQALLWKAPRIFAPFGPLGPPRFRLIQRDEREIEGQALRLGPPIHYYIFNAAPFMGVRLWAIDERWVEGSVNVWKPPRARIIFAPVVTRPFRLFAADEREQAGQVVMGLPRRFDEAPPSDEHTYTAIPSDAGYIGILEP